MWTLHTANAEHWVPIKTVASFKRMREFQARGDAWVADALRQGSTELEVDAAGENVRRRTEVQPPKGQFERSVYAVRRLRCSLDLHVHHGESQTHDGRHVLMMGDVYFAERLWGGGAGAAAAARGVLRQVRQDERGAHAPGGGLEGVQGASQVLGSDASAEVCADTTRCDVVQGSVFVEFADFKSVEAFLNADPKPAWDGKELLIMSK